MFSPITASRNIQEGFTDYITTTFHFADSAYEKAFKQALAKDGAVAKGPYVDIGGSYEAGHSLEQLIDSGDVSPLFRNLEKVPEDKKELKLTRPLYLHQEAAIKKNNQGKSLIVTTGTGSGKTECFLIPIVDHLLRELAKGPLDDAVYAIIIYPMNALANDQMKRMRMLLKSAPDIRFGLYNGNTKHTRKDALNDYHRAHDGQDPLPNEAISREEMQERPPHILITNYSMMEYMLLRPKDDGVFQNAKLKYIVLDEAHIYRGATGMETSLLLRRMHARIAHKGHLRYILTSATLGGPESDEAIVRFARQLCGVSFDESCIVRSKMIDHVREGNYSRPNDLFVDLAAKTAPASDIFSHWNIPYDPTANDEEKLFDLCLNSRQYEALREAARGPVTLPVLLDRMMQWLPMDEKALEAFIEVCGRACKNGSRLIRPRYHFFVRALEGAYVTIGNDKQLWLDRRASVSVDHRQRAVFEAALCTDCGRLAVTGKPDSNGTLAQQSSRNGQDKTDYYLIKQPEDSVWFSDDEEDDVEQEYILCSICGAMRADNGSSKYPCEHGTDAYLRLHKAKQNASGICKCPACETGRLRRFYLGNEAATAVLGTDLYERLPDIEVAAPAVSVKSSSTGLFGARRAAKPVLRDHVRQFLCFSDSRSEAAYFASYMEQSYEEFLRRRGVWHTAEKLRREGRLRVEMGEFIKELTTYFESNRSFAKWDSKGQSVFVDSKMNAWTAMLNEMFNARRATGLMSMGVFTVRYRPNEDIAGHLVERYGLPEADMQALLEQIVMDGIYTGALDAGSGNPFSDAQREYVFFTPTPQKLVLLKEAGSSKKTFEHGWCSRQRPNGNYFSNIRVARLCRVLNISECEANSILKDYWNEILAPDQEKYSFDANDFDVLLYGYEQMPFYRCQKCGRVTSLNVGNRCVNVKCTGTLVPYDALSASADNHYARLYRSEQMKPLYIKEHTAQLSKSQQSLYQDAFVNKQINALSCSTTFEMGVDVGSLETVYMRNVPPSPSNYVQRAGRAGRGRDSAAFVLTYAKLSSHDFTYFGHPESMISGDISVPVFCLENEKIIRRHMSAIALGYFFKHDPDAFGSDDRAALLLEGGYDRFKDMLDPVPEKLDALIKASIPVEMHGHMGISDGSWVDKMIGKGDEEKGVEPGALEDLYQRFHNELRELERERDRHHRNHEAGLEDRVTRLLRMTRAGKDDKAPRRSLIDYLVRNNILPKYGFPVDTVELHQYGSNSIDDDKQLQLSRDLQMAIAEYAPGSEIIADGKLYKSRYIRKGLGKAMKGGWETGSYSLCPKCGQKNFTKASLTGGDGRECVSCHNTIPKRKWHTTIEPRLGFQAEGEGQPVPLHRPERGNKTDDYYIGDPNRNIINRRRFRINNRELVLESTANDSLVVISREIYLVCPRCGYAVEGGSIPPTHKNGRGFNCEAKVGEAREHYLSHDFKTDVVKLTFMDSRAFEWDLMCSVMYALLEGLSREMGIERNDIKGCLHLSDTDEGLIYSIMLYAAVAGGAGNVRRLVTDDGGAFVQVVKKAVELVDNCKCDSSCYNCLRNYYNQNFHDQLDRHKAGDFLRDWLAWPEPIEEDTHVPDEACKTVSFTCDDSIMEDYPNWTELADIYGQDSTMAQWDAAGIPYEGKLQAVLTHPDGNLDTTLLWPEQKLALVDAGKLASVARFESLGWRFLAVDTDPAVIRTTLYGGE